MLTELVTEETIGIFVTFVSLLAFQQGGGALPPLAIQCPPIPELIDFFDKTL